MAAKSPNLRKDVASNTMLPKEELIRIVKNKDGKIFIDPTFKAEGRGVYLKPDHASLKKAKQRNLISRGLKTKVEDEIYDQLEKVING
ncbi:RNase P modulator RnpM [[Acholeplasma] multilocale]|uniref:RNase P modulator RnpM n=1 Tax=[Acholeplasma] multilocale TaxID=264638 RepID=UPI000427B41F|nr:YlxR family protein [[Acholeplasma] multilocale]